MKQIILLSFFLLNVTLLSAQGASVVSHRGTIHLRKDKVKTVVLDKRYKVSKVSPYKKTFRVRFYGYNYVEYFPNGYESDLYPIVFNRIGIFLADENRKFTTDRIYSFEYEVYKSNTLAAKGTGDMASSEMFRLLSVFPHGSCAWIKNLIFVDEEGNVHKSEIGEFCIVKVRDNY
jgi:hypothetical protein